MINYVSYCEGFGILTVSGLIVVIYCTQKCEVGVSDSRSYYLYLYSYNVSHTQCITVFCDIHYKCI